MMNYELDVNAVICMLSIFLMLFWVVGVAIYFIFVGCNKSNDGETYTKTQVVLWYITLILLFYVVIGYLSFNKLQISNELKWYVVLLSVILSIVSFVIFVVFEMFAFKRIRKKKPNTQKIERRKRVIIFSVFNLFFIVIIFLLSILR